MSLFRLMPRLSLLPTLAATFVVAVAAAASAATVDVSDRAELVAAVAAVRPGTTIRIAPGEYRGGLAFGNLQGTAAEKIVLTAADPERPPEFVGGTSGMQLSAPAHLELRNLVFRAASGNGLNIDDGGQRRQTAHHLTLRNLRIEDVGPQGNRDGIKLSGVADFKVIDCTIRRWGDAGSAIDMVGCHRGLIAGCVFRFRSDVPANGVQTKGGSANIAVRRCRFEHAGNRALNIGGSTGRAYFRPRDANYEAREILVEDCTIIGAQAAIAFVGVDGAVVRHNTIYRPQRWVFRILQESRGEPFVACREGVFADNLIVNRQDELRSIANIGPGTAPETFRFARNHWYCIDDPTSSAPQGLPVAEQDGRYGVRPRFVDAARGDLRTTASAERQAGVRPETTAKP
ncbi:right-handed parallel beta-helix repeat-containing protein [Roseimaritima sediminicola]|uniref:right-handed parallel beta-helix repeat-containing protein n=1 Tax=Roseimaritima sediminicola TaxID=2662066 RepID=UPI0012982527|nr:right-handed parallel beta-helix repeat-containing protein [Roseimaritima sediminicola]